MRKLEINNDKIAAHDDQYRYDNVPREKWLVKLLADGEN